MMSNDVAIIFSLENIRWLKDEWGDYWVAELFENGKRVGLIGTYHSLNSDGTARLTREEQEENLRVQFEST